MRNSAVILKLQEWRKLLMQRVSGPAHRMDQLEVEILVDLGPEPAQMRFDDVRFGIEVITPDLLNQHLAGDYAPRILHQHEKDLIFALLERNFQPASRHFAGKFVENQAANLQPGFVTAPISAPQR